MSFLIQINTFKKELEKQIKVLLIDSLKQDEVDKQKVEKPWEEIVCKINEMTKEGFYIALQYPEVNQYKNAPRDLTFKLRCWKVEPQKPNFMNVKSDVHYSFV